MHIIIIVDMRPAKGKVQVMMDDNNDPHVFKSTEKARKAMGNHLLNRFPYYLFDADEGRVIK